MREPNELLSGERLERKADARDSFIAWIVPSLIKAREENHFGDRFIQLALEQERRRHAVG